ncbi:MAG: multiheme c-type cytochrome, partial [Planctomycetaceae bacterium]
MKHRLATGLFLACCGVNWLALSLFFPGRAAHVPTLAAAPHVIAPVGHPYDPDWPEVYMLLRRKCVACHRPGSEIHDFTSYEAIIGRGPDGETPVILPGNPHESLLWHSVIWNHSFAPDSPHASQPLMPPDHRDWLTGGQIAAIERWIARGALEYRLPQTCNIRPITEIDFPSARECSICHPKQFEEWSRSMHAYAQHSPAFEAFTLTLVERTGGTIGTFCTRCHTPLGVSLGETASLRNVHRSRISMEGVTCVVCHRLQRPYYKANSQLPVQPGQVLDTCVFGPFDDPVQFGNATHPASGSDHLRSAAFCGACHDVTSPEGVRLEEAFSEWQNGPAADQGITCQNCHMGPIQGIPIARRDRPHGKAAVVPGIDPSLLPDRPLSDHTFAGPDYALLPDTEFPHKLDWMYETDYRNFDALTPHQQQTLTELRIENRRQRAVADAKRYELLRNAAEIHVSHPHSAARREKIRVHVDVASKFAGHNLPTGFTAERQVWVGLTLTDPLGNVVYASGDLDPNGDLRDEHSGFVESGELAYDHKLLNFQSKFVALTAQGTERSVIISVNRHLAPLNVLRPATGNSQAQGRPL